MGTTYCISTVEFAGARVDALSGEPGEYTIKADDLVKGLEGKVTVLVVSSIFRETTPFEDKLNEDVKCYSLGRNLRRLTVPASAMFD